MTDLPLRNDRTIKAAVVRRKGGPFAIETLTVSRRRAPTKCWCGWSRPACATPIIVIRDQVYPVPLPIVLGHEGAGVVERVGAGVRKVAPGDHVVLSFMSCGHCARCAAGQPAYCAKGHPLCFGGAREDGTTATHDSHAAPVHDHFFGQSSFGTYALAQRAHGGEGAARTCRWSGSGRSAAASRPAPAR